MAGLVQDEINLSLGSSDNNKKSDAPIIISNNLYEKASGQADKLIEVGNKIRDLSPGLTTNFGSQEPKHISDGKLNFTFKILSTNQLDKDFIQKTLHSDYSNKHTLTANLKLIGTGANPSLNNQPEIEINPENVDKIITALEQATKAGQELKKTLLKQSNSLNENEYAQIEIAFRHGLGNELKNITTKPTLHATK